MPLQVRQLFEPLLLCELSFFNSLWWKTGAAATAPTYKDVTLAHHALRAAQICTNQGDLSAGHMIWGVEGADPERRARLVRLLDIDLYQRLTTMSDGQRRRVQIAMGLLRPYDVLLLDEITVDMDVLGRAELLAFFVDECETRGASIVYATHIFDGLESWVTHIAYVEDGEMRVGALALRALGCHCGSLHMMQTCTRCRRPTHHQKHVCATYCAARPCPSGISM